MKLDLTGKIFGRLLVAWQLEERKNGATMYHCVCKCGNEVDVVTASLNLGRTKSCGCLRKERTRNSLIERNKLCLNFQKDREFALLKRCYLGLKGRHKKLCERENINEEIISFEKFKELTLSKCFYCGEKYSNIKKDQATNYILKCNGLDRIDSSKAYSEENVVPCCERCNKMKSNMNQEEFYNKIIQIYEQIKTKNYRILNL